MTVLVASPDQLPAPACEEGYPWTQIEGFMDPQQVARLRLWMVGQTQMLCDGRRYNHDTREYEQACGGVAHGPVVYASDLANFLAAGPILD